MTCEEILRRVEEIEAELGDGSTDDYPAPETITEGEVRWLCRAVRQLVSKMEDVEAVADVACYLHERAKEMQNRGKEINWEFIAYLAFLLLGDMTRTLEEGEGK